MEKKCFKCNAIKPLSDFYRHKMMADGHVNKCKECNKNDVRANRRDKIEYYRSYDAKRCRDQFRLACRYEYISEYRARNPDKYKAHCAVSNAVRDGKIVKPDVCPECNCKTRSIEMHAHHTDYSKPLDVDWMCARCHATRHPRILLLTRSNPTYMVGLSNKEDSMSRNTSRFYCDVSADVRAEKIEFDFGVDRSPRGVDYINKEVNVVTFWVGGVPVEVEPSELPEKLREAIEKEAVDNCYDDEWVE